MKIKSFSWMLAGAYLLCGLGICSVVLKLNEIVSGFGIVLPTVIRMAWGISPMGWLCASLAAALLVVLKDLRFRSRPLNVLFTLVLVSWVGCIVFAVLSILQNGTVSIH